MTSRIRSQDGNVIAADFSRPAQGIELPVSVETIFADDIAVLFRCRVGTHVWHVLVDAKNDRVIST